MKFDKSVTDILKNFANINGSILFRKGNVISTISPSKTVLAKAKLDFEIEKEFGVYELNRFIGVLSAFDTAEAELGDKSLKLTDGNRSVEYFYAAKETMITPPEKDVKIPQAEVTFSLPAATFFRFLSDQSLLSLPSIKFKGDGKKIYLIAFDVKEKKHDNVKTVIGDTDKTFEVVLNVDNVNLLQRDYEVAVTPVVVHFKSDLVEYWIAPEAKIKK